jgi:hypothetical protein
MAPILDEVLLKLPPAYRPFRGAPQQSDAMGINSSNFRLNTAQGAFVLKRWSHKAVNQDVLHTLAIMDWLASQHLPVPAPVKLEEDNFSLSTESGTWSLFPFVEGSYFSGTGDDELNAAAEATGRLMGTLSQIPSTCVPNAGPSHFAVADGELLGRVKDLSAKWDELFGAEHADLLALSWPSLMAEWETLKSNKLEGGRVQAAHFDLHPHNLLVQASEVVAILDFEACKVMPVGFALGFAALKQCRQAMTIRFSTSDPRLVGASYANHLLRAYPGARELVAHLGDLAVAETLRRICIILRLNLETGENKWNKVLGIQIGHLSEARALFG